MKLLKKKSISNSSRHKTIIDNTKLSKKTRIVKTTLKGFKRFYGRSSNNGRITVRRKGGGAVCSYKKILPGNIIHESIVLTSLYDLKKASTLCLVFDLKKKCFFNVSSIKNVSPGTLLSTNLEKSCLFLGDRSYLKNIPVGSIICNLSVKNVSKIQYIKSAGTFGQIVQMDRKFSRVRLPSGDIIQVSVNCTATLGRINNDSHKLICVGNAGRSRRFGNRPKVRGIAMNPVDHPHGGRTNGGRPSVTPWGLPTKGGFYLKKKKI
jgi:large subunit ribosomal protein L2